jgi:hypothetical protein
MEEVVMLSKGDNNKQGQNVMKLVTGAKERERDNLIGKKPMYRCWKECLLVE